VASSLRTKETNMASQGGTHQQHGKAGKQPDKNAGAATDRNMSSSGPYDQKDGARDDKKMKGGQQGNKGKH
jgi:hypothetical protein